MKEPSEELLKLYGLGWIHGLHIEQRQTGTDTAETYCKITGSDGGCEGRWTQYSKYLSVKVGHNFVAEIKPQCVKEAEDWIDFKKKNRRELAEYKRLKEKFEK